MMKIVYRKENGLASDIRREFEDYELQPGELVYEGTDWPTVENLSDAASLEPAWMPYLRQMEALERKEMAPRHTRDVAIRTTVREYRHMRAEMGLPDVTFDAGLAILLDPQHEHHSKGLKKMYDFHLEVEAVRELYYQAGGPRG